jgi:hypothetical protein
MLQHTNRIPGYRLKKILKSYSPKAEGKNETVKENSDV